MERFFSDEGKKVVAVDRLQPAGLSPSDLFGQAPTFFLPRQPDPISEKGLAILFLILLGLLLSVDAEAGRLESAARNAQATILQIAQVSSGIGIGIGAMAYQIGWAHMGKQIMVSGLIGIFATVGGPALINAIQSLF